jgi:hypothetical protein
MTSASPELQLALESDCATGVEEVIAARRGEDLEALRNMLRPDAPVSPAFRQNAIQLLGLWGDAESAPAIRALLPELDERQRINAVDALGRLGGPEAEASVLDATLHTRCPGFEVRPRRNASSRWRARTPSLPRGPRQNAACRARNDGQVSPGAHATEERS